MLSTQEATTLLFDDFIRQLDASSACSFISFLCKQNQDSPLYHEKSSSQVYVDTAAKIKEILSTDFRQAKKVRDLPFSSLFTLAEMIVDELAPSPEIRLEALNPRVKNYFFPRHLLNVSILSCLTGQAMKLPKTNLVQLTVAGLLHDIGMILVDPRIHYYTHSFSAYERKLLERHPAEAHKALEGLSAEFPWLLRVLLEEHKRKNGDGYPKDWSGELHPYSQIIGLCDTFEALTHERPFRKAFHPAEALRQLVQKQKREFADPLLKALIEAVSFYPIGSMVLLNNEKTAKVVTVNPQNLLKPEVQVIEGAVPTQVFYNLAAESNIFIRGIAYGDLYQHVK